MTKTKIIAAALGLALLGATEARAEYYVILGSYPLKYQEEAAENSVRVVQAANRCDIRPKVGHSQNFIGLRPGLILQVVGPYATRDRAEAMKFVARRCVPDAFVKESLYIGDE